MPARPSGPCGTGMFINSTLREAFPVAGHGGISQPRESIASGGVIRAPSGQRDNAGVSVRKGCPPFTCTAPPRTSPALGVSARPTE